MKNRLIWISILIIGIAMHFSACTFDNEEELFADAICDTTEVSYKDAVVPILQTSCLACHSTANAPNFGSIDLEGYDDVSIYVDNGRLWGSINHDSGFLAMPLNGSKLPDCNLSIIKAWIEQGALDN